MATIAQLKADYAAAYSKYKPAANAWAGAKLALENSGISAKALCDFMQEVWGRELGRELERLKKAAPKAKAKRGNRKTTARKVY